MIVGFGTVRGYGGRRGPGMRRRWEIGSPEGAELNSPLPYIIVRRGERGGLTYYACGSAGGSWIRKWAPDTVLMVGGWEKSQCTFTFCFV